MANRNETLRLTPEALSEGLTRAGISLREFCHLFDVGYDNARRWLLPDTHARAMEPPYWISPVLAVLSHPGIGAGALNLARDERETSIPQESSHAD